MDYVKERSRFRQDIQALRGVAVLLVLLFHAQFGGLAAGYLGVDIFFVLSGYLITGVVDRRLTENRFSFSSFYLDRAKRLLPAAYVVYTATAIAGYWFLTTSEFDRFRKTLWGALTFTANIVLWTGTDYFTPSAKYNPLLHVWSLAIEEQFYFFLPLALFLTPSRYRLALVVIGGGSSLALCLYFTPTSPVAAFYLLPSRAWELALGGALALAETRHQGMGLMLHASSKLRYGLGIGALGAILIVAAFAPGMSLFGSRHPGIDAILVCLASATLLAIRFGPLEHGPIAWGLTRIGDISYSLYLVHWPLYAFASNAYIGEGAPLSVRIILLLLSFFLAFLIYRYVEEPMRTLNFGIRRYRPALTAIAATLVIGLTADLVGYARSVTQTEDFTIRSANFGLNERCDFVDRFEPYNECASSAAPDTLLWGDSFAMHLAPGLAAIGRGGIWQATKSLCGPIIDLAPAWPSIPYSRQWSVDCIDFNKTVEQFLAEHFEIKLVVLSSPFSQYTSDLAAALVSGPGGLLEHPLARRQFVTQFVATIDRMRALGKEIVIVGPTPATGFDVGLCHERKLVGLVTFGPHQDCLLQAEAARHFRARVDSVLAEVATLTGARLINLADFLCDDTICHTEIDGVPLYWDAGHFSAAGSIKVMTATAAGASILGTALIGANNGAGSRVQLRNSTAPTTRCDHSRP